ncbi:ATP-binding protein [Nocardia higoensis]|uniref:ATP-binding protein n=1 Tax=Nocardia higoensis TaxID=228599 RepID=UPI00059468E6|nr:ATP-binding protein [Nocardia higoensis]
MVPSRLLTRLDRAAAGPAPVLLVTAPAGSGKTALTAAWIEHLSRVRPGTRTLRIPGERAPEFLRHRNIHRLCDETRYGDTVLVIDDAHRLVTGDAVRIVEQFLHTAPPRLITVLVARRPPALSWHTLTAAARLTRFTAADLALDRAGTAELAAAAGCPLDAAELRLVHDLTRGWPTLVRLAASYLDTHREYRSAALTMLEHAPRPIAEFLATEVLPALDDAQREVLTATRLLPEFTPDLADALTEGSATSALERLEHAGFPLRRHRHDEVLHYSYPPLLRGHFIHTARPTADAVWTDPPSRSDTPAAGPTGRSPSAEPLRHWCRTHPSPTVLPHLLAEPDRPQLVEFLRAHAVRLVLDANGPALFGPLEDARTPLLDDPVLILLHTTDALVRGERLTHLTHPLRRTSRIADQRGLAALESAVAADLAIHADTATLHALSLPTRPTLTGHAATDYYAELSLATAHALRGDTCLGERGLRRALALGEAMAAPRLRLRAQMRLALTAVLAGHPAIAEERADHAVELARGSGLAGTADHLRAVAIRRLCVAQRAETRGAEKTVQPAGAGTPRVAEIGDNVLLRSVRRVVAESSR